MREVVKQLKPAPRTAVEAAERPVAVIDIGSNSIRLVVYESFSRAPAPIFNEKNVCCLGEGLAETGRMREKNMERARQTIERYIRLTRRMNVGALHVFATAAAREAENGPAFVEALERDCGIDIRVLSGGREGKLAALGVLSGMPSATGIVGDLGGGSLELVPVRAGKRSKGVTLPLGALRLSAHDPQNLSGYIDAQLRSVNFLFGEPERTCDFHVVGGSWRAIGRVHMLQNDYPLHIVHGYTVDADEIRDLCRLLSRLSPGSVANVDGVPRERARTLPLSALVLSRFIKLVGPARICFSAYGVREGVLFSALDKTMRRRDPLIEACRVMGRRNARFEPQGEYLFDWLSPLFQDEDERHARLRLAASIMCDFGWRVHPEFRADYAIMETLRSPLVGIDHWERCYLALALRSRYSHVGGRGLTKEAQKLIGKEASKQARRVGLALRLALTLSGGQLELLRHFAVRSTDEELRLEIQNSEASLFGEIVENRFRHLADALDKRPDVAVIG